MRQKVKQQNAKERINNFFEVTLGYTKKQAQEEASRCLLCKDPLCVKGCPVEIDIPAFIKLIREDKIKEALDRIKERNYLPAVCGRVCPQEDQCEAMCILNKKKVPINIGALERYAADYGKTSGKQLMTFAKLIRMLKKLLSLRGGRSPTKQSPRDCFASLAMTKLFLLLMQSSITAESRTPNHEPRTRIAIVGSGPAGLTIAADLAKIGYSITLFESLHLAGGVLSYGIPEFRLPKKIVDEELDYIKSLGVEIQTNVLVGKTFTIKDLFEKGYPVIFLGLGAGLPQFLNIPGENLDRVYSANEFLTRINLMRAYEFPEYRTPVNIGKKTAVIGGGNVAFDAARCALRLGSEVTIVYRRSEAEMPARSEEIKNARDEGIRFQLLTQPVRIPGDENGFVKGLECIKMRLGEPEGDGRPRPILIKDSNFVMDIDTVIVAIGQTPNPLLSKATAELSTNPNGTIAVDENYMTSIPGVFAGGDIVTGADTVIAAMGAGKRAAVAIDEYLQKLVTKND